MGTNHQDITGIERVVFVGDSVTLGTPPTASDDWFRNRLADELTVRYGLEAPSWEWRLSDLIDGDGLLQDSGDFSVCARYGARTDDMYLDPHRQLQTCLPEEQRDKTTLVVMTVGGNDLYALLEDLGGGVDAATLQTQWETAMQDLRDAIHWLRDDPSLFPGGVHLIFANIFNVNDDDAAADIGQCDGADLLGFDDWLSVPLVHELSVWLAEQYMALAVETETDMMFMGETFCGHGYMNEDPDGRCYRGPDTDLWFDFTCMHPSAAGHSGLYDMVLAVIDE